MGHLIFFFIARLTLGSIGRRGGSVHYMIASASGVLALHATADCVANRSDDTPGALGTRGLG